MYTQVWVQLTNVRVEEERRIIGGSSVIVSILILHE